MTWYCLLILSNLVVMILGSVIGNRTHEYLKSKLPEYSPVTQKRIILAVIILLTIFVNVSILAASPELRDDLSKKIIHTESWLYSKAHKFHEWLYPTPKPSDPYKNLMHTLPWVTPVPHPTTPAQESVGITIHSNQPARLDNGVLRNGNATELERTSRNFDGNVSGAPVYDHAPGTSYADAADGLRDIVLPYLLPEGTQANKTLLLLLVVAALLVRATRRNYKTQPNG